MIEARVEATSAKVHEQRKWAVKYWAQLLGHTRLAGYNRGTNRVQDVQRKGTNRVATSGDRQAHGDELSLEDLTLGAVSSVGARVERQCFGACGGHLGSPSSALI